MQKEEIKLKKSLKTRFYLLILLAGIALTGRALYRDHNFKLNILWDKIKSDDVTSIDQGDNLGMPSAVVGSYLEGRLENSDDTQRGNFKLVSSLGQIYIRTSRDFSALIGFDVLMTIDGTLDKFTLLNVERRLEKNGYIQPQ